MGGENSGPLEYYRAPNRQTLGGLFVRPTNGRAFGNKCKKQERRHLMGARKGGKFLPKTALTIRFSPPWMGEEQAWEGSKMSVFPRRLFLTGHSRNQPARARERLRGDNLVLAVGQVRVRE